MNLKILDESHRSRESLWAAAKVGNTRAKCLGFMLLAQQLFSGLTLKSSVFTSSSASGRSEKIPWKLAFQPLCLSTADFNCLSWIKNKRSRSPSCRKLWDVWCAVGRATTRQLMRKQIEESSWIELLWKLLYDDCYVTGRFMQPQHWWTMMNTLV